MFDAGLLVNKPYPPSLSFQSMGVRFTTLRRETPWLQRLPHVPVRYALKYQAEVWVDPSLFRVRFGSTQGT